MNVSFVWPDWCHLPWTESLPNIFGDDGRHSVITGNSPSAIADVIIYGWCDKATSKFIEEVNVKQVVFIRSYDFYLFHWQRTNWDKVSLIYFVNDVYCTEFNLFFKDKYKDKTRVLYNAVDFAKWPFKERGHGKNIAVVGLINYKKNLPLALQIVSKVPKDCNLHFFGDVQDVPTYSYILYLAKKLRVRAYLHGALPQKHLYAALTTMNYLLCCSIIEGNPNNVNEAMAMGLKPVIHSWPGSKQQYPEDLIYSSVDEAVYQLSDKSPYESMRYRQIAEERFSLKNLYEVRDEVEKLR